MVPLSWFYERVLEKFFALCPVYLVRAWSTFNCKTREAMTSRHLRWQRKFEMWSSSISCSPSVALNDLILVKLEIHSPYKSKVRQVRFPFHLSKSSLSLMNPRCWQKTHRQISNSGDCLPGFTWLQICRLGLNSLPLSPKHKGIHLSYSVLVAIHPQFSVFRVWVS